MEFDGLARIRTGDHRLVRTSFEEREPLSRDFGKIRVSKGLSESYLEYRYSKVKSKMSKYWIEKCQRELMERTNGVLSRESLIKFQNWYLSHYSYQTQKKFYDNTRAFLEFVFKHTGNPLARELKEILDRPQKPSKKINEILIREPDVHNVIKAIYTLPPSPYDPPWKTAYYKIKYIAAILFAAYTGQRPDATIHKLTHSDFEEALKRDPPMLWVPAEKDKEWFPHWVPLHPVVVEWLQPVLKYRHLNQSYPQTDSVFSYNSVRQVLTQINVKAIHTGRKITYSHFRKFFEQMCNNVLMVHPGLRDYIMAHNTGSLNVQSYDGKLPKEIYEQYMAAWKKVNLVPEGVELEELLKTIDE